DAAARGVMSRLRVAAMTLRFRRSIALPLVGLLVLLSSGGAIVSHLVNVSAIENSLRESERDKVNHIGYIVETAIRSEAPRLSALARSLKDHLELKQRFALRQHDGGEAALRSVLDRLYLDTRVDVLEVVDSAQAIVYRAEDPGRHGDRAQMPA